MQRGWEVDWWGGGGWKLKKGLNPEVLSVSLSDLPVCCPLRRSGAAVSTPSGCVVSKALLLNVQPGPIHAQPFFSLGVIRHHFIHFVPERVRVVEVVHVAKLMHDDVINDGLWGHHALPVEGNLAGCRTAGPTVSEFLHNDTDRRYPKDPIARAMDMLRNALSRRGTRATGAPRKPREGTKQEVVLAMLRRPEGATVAQIAEATGWAQHTVRGFFAGMKKRQGITVEIAERIRQVGPNKQGAKGSYTVYRVAE